MTPEANRKQVFVSYKSSRSPFGPAWLKLVLPKSQYAVVSDLDAPRAGGDPLRTHLLPAVRGSDFVVLLVTEEVAHSDAVRLEISVALQEGKEIVPVLLVDSWQQELLDLGLPELAEQTSPGYLGWPAWFSAHRRRPEHLADEIHRTLLFKENPFYWLRADRSDQPR